MTRINSGINPQDLTDQHLLAEYREIVRIPNAVIKAYNKNNSFLKNKKQPLKYTLGTGHVLYFYDNIKHLHKRFNSLCAELKHRKYNLTIDDDSFIKFKDKVDLRLCFYRDNIDEKYAANIVKDRIIERVINSKKINTINKIPIDINTYTNNLYKKYENK